MEIKVVCCKRCRTIIDEDLFHLPVLKDGSKNYAQGLCSNCGSDQFTEGRMGPEYERLYWKGEVHPKISQVGGALVEDPLKDQAPKYFFPSSWERKAETPCPTSSTP